MGTYIPPNRWTTNGNYVVGKSTMRIKHYARLGAKGSWPARLSSRYDQTMSFEFGCGMFFIGLVAGLIMMFVGAGIYSGGAQTAGNIVAWIGVVGGGLAMLISLLSGLYFFVGSFVDGMCRPPSHWGCMLQRQERVFPVGEAASRPAINALGGDAWFAKYGNQYSGVIDEFLTRSEVTKTERLLAEDGIDSALRTRAEAELTRLAHGAIKSHTNALEADAAAEMQRRDKQYLAEREARANRANRLLEGLLDEELATVVTSDEVAKTNLR